MPTGPIITLTTDFGLIDFYVPAMKAVLLQRCPNAILLDITHQIHRQDLVSGSFVLERAIASFAPKTTHLAVVDPDVGTDRRMIVVEMNGSRIVCPDNGLITWAWRKHPGAVAYELTWRPNKSSNTFQGRDVMAPVVGMLAAGAAMSSVAGAAVEPVLLDLRLSDSTEGQIIHIDHFGNATTNLREETMSSEVRAIEVGGNLPIPLRRTYADVGVGEPLALVSSSELLEIAIRNGSAAESLNIKIGDHVRLV